MTYNYDNTRQRLLHRQDPTEFATWYIYGEDPNCDMSGHHANPLLETVEGRLMDVVEYAMGLSGFWQWGAGGKIEKLKTATIKRVPKHFIRAERKYELTLKKKQLEAELTKIEAELKGEL